MQKMTSRTPFIYEIIHLKMFYQFQGLSLSYSSTLTEFAKFGVDTDWYLNLFTKTIPEFHNIQIKIIDELFMYLNNVENKNAAFRKIQMKIKIKILSTMRSE